MGKYGKNDYQPKPNVKLGTVNNPLSLNVKIEQRKLEVEALIAEHDFIVNIEVNTESEEDIIELEALLNKPTTQRFEKTPERNDPCSCGSGKKYCG